jgi:hypothetical protein
VPVKLFDAPAGMLLLRFMMLRVVGFQREVCLRRLDDESPASERQTTKQKRATDDGRDSLLSLKNGMIAYKLVP